MAPWRDDYLASLQEAERNNPVNKDLVEACSQLADRVAALEAEKLVWAAGSPAANTTTTTATSTKPAPTSLKPPSTSEAASSTASSEGAAQLRLDLAEALRGRGQAQTRLKAVEAELATLRSKNRVDSKRIADLTSSRDALTARFRDKNAELVDLRKLLKEVQDELLTVNMELNMMTQKHEKLQAEHKEFMARWMEEKRREADALNLQNESLNKNRI
ncbi:autophagy-related protein 16 [Xylaria arbuscula]|nr:autophagy-related protein 16 [Xylaria arbuscula]